MTKNKSAAKATVIPVERPPELPEVVLELTLTRKQAEDIYGLCNQIGGDPETTTRGVFDDIRMSLSAAGFGTSDRRFHGSITFKSAIRD